MRTPRSHWSTRGAASAMFWERRPTFLIRKQRTKLPLSVCEARRFPHHGRAMLDSIRTRLTLWYTAVLALVIGVLCTVAYFIFWRSAVQRTDANLIELSDSFLVTLRAELEDQTGPDVFQAAAHAAIDEHHFRDTVYAIADQTGKVILTSLETPSANPSSRAERSVETPSQNPPSRAERKVLSSASFQNFLDASLNSDRLFAQIPVSQAGFRGFAQHFTAKGRTYI